MTFSMLLLLTFTAAWVIAFVCLFQATLETGWVIFSILVSFLVALCLWPTKWQAKTNNWLISKNWPFLVEMLVKLFILDFKHFSFWQTIFKKQAKPSNLSLSSSTWIGLLQNLQGVKVLANSDNFSKDTKMLFSFEKNILCSTESLCDSASNSPPQELSSVVTKSRSSS